LNSELMVGIDIVKTWQNISTMLNARQTLHEIFVQYIISLTESSS
jgi:hypothetical protein